MAEPGFKPWAAGWAARILPLCYAAPDLLVPCYHSVVIFVNLAPTWCLCNSLFQRGLLHELSNDGAQDQFEHFLEELILPQMVS